MGDKHAVKKQIISSFKFNGMSVRGDACDYLVSQLESLDAAEQEDWMEKLTEHIQRQSLSEPVIERKHVEAAIRLPVKRDVHNVISACWAQFEISTSWISGQQIEEVECCKSETEGDENIINVISAFHLPRFMYNPDRKKFLPAGRSPGPQLFDSPSAKCNMYQDRYKILLQKTKRHKLFSGASEANLRGKLKTVEYLLSMGGRIMEIIVLGMITQLKEGKYFIEDPTGTILLDLSQAKYHTGYYPETVFVLAEGWYQDKVMHVVALSYPPREPPEISRVYYGGANTFGGPSLTSCKSSVRLKKKEVEKEDAMILFIADVWLDKPKVVEKLSIIFAGYNDPPPTAVVLMGNFLSSNQGAHHAYILKGKFKLLADIILDHPNLVAQTKFVIVPGPTDSPSANILPRPPLPGFIAEELTSRVPGTVFTTNPCRLQYCTQEVVIVREDLVTKMCRNSIHYPDSSDVPHLFAKTVLSQGHLAPLPLNVCPVYWSYDSALHLYPPPDLIVVADQQKSFTTVYNDTTVINPGSFLKTDFSFKVYFPSVRQVDDCQIADD